jgi:hypothetical protein
MKHSANEGRRLPFSKKTVAWVAGLAGAALVSALREGSMAGLSELLVIGYSLSWAAVAFRHLLQLSAGYYRAGLGRPMLCELGTLAVWGALAWMLSHGENPQISTLALVGLATTVLFFFSATRLEDSRSKRAELGATPPPRATEVLKQSRLWRGICRRFAQIDFEHARRVRDFIAELDSEDGKLSLAASIILLIVATIGGFALTLILASTVFPVKLTSEHVPQKAPEEKRRSGKHSNPSPHRESLPPRRKPESSGIASSCGEPYDPGPTVPEPERSSLILAWQGVAGIQPGPVEALGFEVAGCPRPARPIPGEPRSWYALGYCDEELRTVAVAPEGLSHPIVMLEQAAEFVLPMILNRRFLSAVDRFDVGDGDAYVIDGHEGSFVLIRDRKTGGPVHRDDGAESGCRGYADEDVRYTIVPPSMLEIWRAVAAISPGGVYPIGYVRDENGVVSIDFRSPEGIVASGSCSIPDGMCRIELGGNPIEGRRGVFITQREVEALVDPE